ncbi:MAG: hypothetical protein EZS28_044902 [Streblomastix strix]|uniref:Uncharacterized protein n=1 Tax=Streblomastix strix TaxID=222440 RepID=A0A5J4TQ79_9EUKA|nr:MAG: hypothetical protein EZS28_044902 [Streblomastix strix]
MIKDGTSQQLLLASGETADVSDYLPKQFPHAMGQMIIEPNNDIRNQGIRLMKNKNNWDSFVLTGCNNDPTNTDELVSPLPTPPVEQAIKQSLVRGVYESFAWGKLQHIMEGDEAKPQFTGATFTIALNAVMFITKTSSNPIVWTNAVPIDCYIDVDGHVRINTLCQVSLPNDFCVQRQHTSQQIVNSYYHQ